MNSGDLGGEQLRGSLELYDNNKKAQQPEVWEKEGKTQPRRPLLPSQ